MLNFGHDSNHAINPYDSNIDQGQQNTCAVRSQELILRDYGIQIPQAELRDYAEEQGWYDDGTPFGAVGNLLTTCGIDNHISDGNNVYDLINELQQGHRIIVGVDAYELWAEKGSLKWHFYQMLDNPNHALIVAGVNVDINDPSKSTVILTDPGKGEVYVEYSMDQFAKAWKDSNFFMCTTEEAAPYQYNAETHQMELSNFATEYSMAEFPFHNEFSDIYELSYLNSDNYNPYYSEGHLHQLNDELSYEQFIEHFSDSNFDEMHSLFHVEQDDSWSQFRLGEGETDYLGNNSNEDYVDPIQTPLELDLGNSYDE